MNESLNVENRDGHAVGFPPAPAALPANSAVAGG